MYDNCMISMRTYHSFTSSAPISRRDVIVFVDIFAFAIFNPFDGHFGGGFDIKKYFVYMERMMYVMFFSPKLPVCSFIKRNFLSINRYDFIVT